jgi:hypothetical protein
MDEGGAVAPVPSTGEQDVDRDWPRRLAQRGGTRAMAGEGTAGAGQGHRALASFEWKKAAAGL